MAEQPRALVQERLWKQLIEMGVALKTAPFGTLDGNGNGVIDARKSEWPWEEILLIRPYNVSSHKRQSITIENSK